MSNELAKREEGKTSMFHQPERMEQALFLAEKIRKSSLCPWGLKTDSDVLLVLMMGEELGQSPMWALQNINAVRNKLSITAEGQHALVRKSPMCKSWDYLETSADRCVLQVCRVGGKPATVTWDKERAQRAGLWDGMASPPDKRKDSPWVKHPGTMLRHRCESEAARMVFPDIVQGLHQRDEIIEAEAIDVTPQEDVTKRAHPMLPAKVASRMDAHGNDVDHAVEGQPIDVEEVKANLISDAEAGIHARNLSDAIDGLGYTVAQRLVAEGCTTEDDVRSFIAGGGRVPHLRSSVIDWATPAAEVAEKPAPPTPMDEATARAERMAKSGKSKWDAFQTVAKNLVLSQHCADEEAAKVALLEHTGSVDHNDIDALEWSDLAIAWVAIEMEAEER